MMRYFFALPSLSSAIFAMLLAFTVSASHGQDLPRWNGYPTPRTGKIVVKVDSASGKVIGAAMFTSTGDPKLDAYAINAFRHARFKRGTVPMVRIPLTFTKAGMKY